MATRLATPGCVVRVSLDAFTERPYDQTNRPQTGHGSFQRIIANLEGLAAKRSERHSPLQIGIAYFMIEANSGDTELRNVIAWADGIVLDFLRFSVPSAETGGSSLPTSGAYFCSDLIVGASTILKP